ncbi:killer cell lectin-like receptor subfamily F member 1 isoform X1 [Sceloporus undulatus]|uniref:killer cell lectin-like receptor subfamily F member 1 isoform X1 n=1 Tax=Sceloporus undulatus TaxID=8520 RepID=UPI001C4DCA95|nr:killer cell lectin-like receptor subfamily F member 1 isoform X1 [Sceloporus undulatus]
MEDEEGYMALSPRLCSGTSIHYAQAKRSQDVSKRLIHYRISLGVLGAICALLGSAVIVVVMFGFQSGCHEGEAEAINTIEDEGGTMKGLKRIEISPSSSEIVIHLCEPFTENATCKLCPANWREEKGTCYWFSKEKRDWSEGYSDCSMKRAQMLVIKDTEEMKFIYDSVQEKYPVWLGLNFTPSVKSWTWVDGTTLNQTLIQLLPAEGGASCGVIKSKPRSEMCTAEFRWICEKEAILL